MRILLIDNQPIFREGLKSIIEAQDDLTIVGEADTCQDVLQDAENADLLILDGEMDSFGLLTSLHKSRAKGRPPYVLVLTRYVEEQHAVQMLKAGADGYMCKSDPPEAVVEAPLCTSEKSGMSSSLSSGATCPPVSGRRGRTTPLDPPYTFRFCRGPWPPITPSESGGRPGAPTHRSRLPCGR